MPHAALSATTLAVGDIQVLGATADSDDSFAFVLWAPIDSGTVIRFMDQSFTNATTGVIGSENDMSLTFNSSLPAGTVIRVIDGGTTTVNGSTFTGTKNGSLSGISNDGDQIFAYQGTAIGTGTSFSGRTLLYGLNIADTSWRTTGSATAQLSFLPTAINSLDANVDSGNFDNVGYTGARTGMTEAAYRAAVGNIANYTQNDTRFDLLTTAFTVGSSVSLYWDANGTTANNGGSGTWDTTTQSLFKNGASGTTYLHWVNSSAGNDHIAVFGGTAGTVSVASGGVTASGLQFDTTGYTIQSNTVTLIGTTPTINVTTGTSTISSAIAGTTGMTKSGSGTLVLSGTNTFTGGMKVTNGTLTLGSNNGLASTTVVTLGSGTTSGRLVLGTALGAVNMTITGLATSGTGTANAVVGGNASVSTLTILDNVNYTYTGVFGGTGTNENNLNIVRSGSVSSVTTLTGNSTATGTVSVQTGTISVGSVTTGMGAQPLGAGNSIRLGSAGASSGKLLYTGGAGTLDKNLTALGNGTDTVQNAGSGLLTLSGTLTKNGTTLILQGGASGIKVTGTITGSSASSDLVVDGGSVTLENANTYNGPTYIRNGATLNANATNALPTSPARSDVILDDTGSGSSTVSLGTSQAAASLRGSATSSVILGANTLTVGESSGTTTYNGTILGTGNLVKDGGSTQVLTNASNAYSGTTTVSGGTLQVGVSGVGKSGTGATTINGSGAVLAGTGSVEGVTTSVILGIVMPGDNGGAGTGTLNTKTLIFTPASSTTVAELQILSTTVFDRLSVTGNITLNSSSNIVVNGSGYAPALGDTFILMDWSGLITLNGFSTGDFRRTGNNAAGNEGNLDLPDITGIGFWEITPLNPEANGGGLTLTIVNVPEPTRGLLLIVGSLTLALRRNRKMESA